MRALICICFIAASPPAWSWTPAGHQTVGAIAERLLTGTHAARQAHAILSPGETLGTAAVWADCVKGVSEQPPYRYKVEARFPECTPFSSRSGRKAMEAYVKRNLDACRPGPGEETCHRQYHYVNIAMQREAYAAGVTGASDHDVVAGIRACIAVLRGQRSPPPFDIRGKREALRLLAHLVGDIHQPLHVGSIYLDATGSPVDPDITGLVPASFTRGGNNIRVGNQNLHGIWDAIPAALAAPEFPGSIEEEIFDVIPPSQGPVENWPQQWATGSLAASREAFAGLQFSAEVNAGTPEQRWTATLPSDYALTRERIQRSRLIAAGARLAGLLRTIWP